MAPPTRQFKPGNRVFFIDNNKIKYGAVIRKSIPKQELTVKPLNLDPNLWYLIVFDDWTLGTKIVHQTQLFKGI